MVALQLDRLMRRFHSDLHPRAETVDIERVGPIGGMLLFVISEQSPITAGEIAKHLGRDKSQVSRGIGLLMRKGLVDRAADSDDARRVQLCLSEAGALQVAAFHGALVETTKSLLGGLTADEQTTFSDLIGKVLEVDR